MCLDPERGIPVFENIMTTVIEQVTEIIGTMGYLGIAVCMTIESCNILLPSEIILPFGGCLVYKGQLSFWGAVLAGTIGGTIGSIISYYIGLLGGSVFLEKYGKYVGLSKHRLEEAELWFSKYGKATSFITRLVPGVRTIISFPAGALKVNIFDFIVFTFAGTLIWSTFLTYIGLILGEKWESIGSWFDKADLILLVVILFLVVRYFWKQRRPSQNGMPSH